MRKSYNYQLKAGNSGNVPENLKVKNNKKIEVRAKAADYTSIKWTIRKLMAQTKIEVSYRAKVK